MSLGLFCLGLTCLTYPLPFPLGLSHLACDSDSHLCHFLISPSSAERKSHSYLFLIPKYSFLLSFLKNLALDDKIVLSRKKQKCRRSREKSFCLWEAVPMRRPSSVPCSPGSGGDLVVSGVQCPCRSSCHWCSQRLPPSLSWPVAQRITDTCAPLNRILISLSGGHWSR